MYDKYFPLFTKGRLARIISFFVKHSWTREEEDTTTARHEPNRRERTGPSFSERLWRVRWTGCLRRWRCPISGREKDGDGGRFLWRGWWRKLKARRRENREIREIESKRRSMWLITQLLWFDIDILLFIWCYWLGSLILKHVLEIWWTQSFQADNIAEDKTNFILKKKIKLFVSWRVFLDFATWDGWLFNFFFF